ncbi:MAG: YaiO family outer membrane beta-barrel protein, partial [Gemmatimonadaceae bacterium]
DKGTLFGIGVTQTLSEPWYAFAAVTGGTGAFYLPNVRVTALLNRKLLPSRRLVVNAGGSYAKWKDAHNDRGLAAGALYYFESPLILEVGTNRNFSYPGNVQSQSYFVTAIEGRPGAHVLVVRASGGREAYQVLAPGQPIADFNSHSGSVTLRQWLTAKAGAVVGAEHYGNEFYQRNGFTLGAFWNLE